LATVVLGGALETAARLAPGEAPLILPNYSPLFIKFADDLQKPFFKPAMKDGNSVLVHARSVNIFRGKFYRGESSFEAAKPAKRLRVIAVGESTVAIGEFTTSLQAYLNAFLPGADVEVINAGQGFINPPHVLKVLREMLQYHPDAIVVYMGHNFRHYMPEVNPWVLRLALAADHSRAARWAVHWTRGALRVKAPEVNDDFNRQAFERSLAEMGALARANGVQLVVCTAASNLLLPPHFSPDRFGDPALRLSFGKALLAFETGQWDRAVRLFSDLALKEDNVALLHYFLGMAERGLRHGPEARRRFSRARDLDFDDRAPDDLNRTVRRLSAEESLYRVADAEREFDAAAPDGIPGFELFMDQCHPRRQHYRLIARPVAMALERAGFAGGRWRRLTRKDEDRALAEVAAPEDRAQVLNSLLNTAFITTLNETYYGESGFSEIPTRYFEEAFKLDSPGTLKRLEDPNGAEVLLEVLSPTSVSPEVRRKTRFVGMVHAGAALRRMGRDDDAERLWRTALPELDGLFTAQLRLQQAVLEHRRGRDLEARKSLALAASASPEIQREPLYEALRAAL